MMPLPDSFNITLAEFSEKIGQTLVLEDGRCSFVVDGAVEVELDYIDAAHVVIAWATVGIAPEDEHQSGRAKALLALNEIGAENGGFSFAMDPESRRIVAQDRKSVV